MATSYDLRINFLPFSGELPTFRVYRKLRQASDTKPCSDVSGFSLPIEPNSNERSNYWVGFIKTKGFEEFQVDCDDNVHLTRRALFHSLRAAVESTLQADDYEIPKDGFFEELSFNFTSFEEGREQLKVQPYYLRSKHIFGWLIDFQFRVKTGVPSSRRVQQLSLSLDKHFKRNLDCYLDRMNRIEDFLKQRRDILDNVCLVGTSTPIPAATDFISLPAKRLRSKTYLFDGNRNARSQFNGLRQHGPLEPLALPPKLLFAFREVDRQAARTLAIALKGSKSRERFNFPGFEALFKSPLLFDSDPIILSDLTMESFKKALERVKSVRSADHSTMPIFILPDGDDNGYMEHKAIFSHEGIPTQVCTLKVINDAYALKWSVANIALQIFCKSGGQPWKVQPTPERTLIIGISQSHKIIKDVRANRVEQYFAFSVLTDNSGLFQQLRVLGESKNESTYLNTLKTNLRQLLSDQSKEFSQVVVHTSFRLKRNEMKTIEETVRSAANDELGEDCRFAVVKINHHNRFFGINPDVNSLVPYEGTVVGLGGGENLIWFEGIFPDKQTVTKAFPGPTHLTFLRVSHDDPIRDESLLQDLVNLSGCNWRGFNAKSAPVSVFYCQLVADLVHDFHDGGLPLPKVQDLRPWFI